VGRADEVCFLGGPRRIPQKYPDFQLEDELGLEGGRDVMWGRTYRRRRDVCHATERAVRAQEEDTTRDRQ
jgi:hypothetical protein